MDGVYTTRLSDPDMTVCRDCPTCSQCAVLDACMRVLDSASHLDHSLRTVMLVRTLRDRVFGLGYAYPYGRRRCALAGNADEAADLIDASIEAFQTIHR